MEKRSKTPLPPCFSVFHAVQSAAGWAAAGVFEQRGSVLTWAPGGLYTFCKEIERDEACKVFFSFSAAVFLFAGCPSPDGADTVSTFGDGEQSNVSELTVGDVEFDMVISGVGTFPHRDGRLGGGHR